MTEEEREKLVNDMEIAILKEGVGTILHSSQLSSMAIAALAVAEEAIIKDSRARIEELKELVESAYREGWWDAAPCYQHPQQAATQFESDWNASHTRVALEVKQNENT
jgi:hypothetical protein